MRLPRASGRFLNSRLGRRLFATSFVMVALPLAAISLLSYGLTDLILRRATEQMLQESTKSMVLNLIDRMRSAEGLLRAAAGDGTASQANSALQARAGVVFSSIELRPAAPGDGPVPGTSRLGVMQPDAAQPPTIEIEVPAATAGLRAVGRLNADYLWENLQSGLYNVCVTGPGIRGDFCQSPDKRSPHSVVSARPLYFRPYFEAEGWTLTAIAEPQVTAYLPVGIGAILGAVAALGLLAALMASSFYLRRTTTPLDALMEATRAVRRGDFQHPVPLTGMSDEFRDLGESFNTMTAEVGADLRLLQVLARIDQAILDHVPLQDTLQPILSHVAAHLPGLRAALVVWDHGGAAPLEYRLGEDGTLRTGIAPADGLEAVPATWEPGRLLEQAAMPLRHVPVVRTEERSVWLRLEQEAPPTDTLRRSVKELRDFVARLAVAVQADYRERQLIARAAHDSLTGLLNRLGLVDALDQLIAATGASWQGFAVAYLDLDGFKDVNDAYGHDVGDRLLKEVARRIATALQPAPLALARLGGDEFVFVLQADADGHYRRRVAGVLHEVQRRYVVAETDILVGGSIGVALYPDHGSNHDELLRHADLAMYAAKNSGRNRMTEFEFALNSASAERLELRRDLDEALAEQQFFLVYQPRVHAQTGQIHSVEALVRWRHPAKGLVPPDKFISLAEETGRIVELGFWVMEEAFRQFNAWKAEGRLHIDKISVNLSPVQLTHTGFLEGVEERMQRHAIPASAIELEVTEGALIRDIDSAIARLAYLQRLGFDIALDDFGVGYSAMSYLSLLPFNTLKVDKSFVDDIDQQKSAYAIAAAIVALAKALDKRVVAEGVETPGQRDTLQRLGVDELQGYLFSKPLPPEEVGC